MWIGNGTTVPFTDEDDHENERQEKGERLERDELLLGFKRIPWP
jgi:hypothetical protein